MKRVMVKWKDNHVCDYHYPLVEEDNRTLIQIAIHLDKKDIAEFCVMDE